MNNSKPSTLGALASVLEQIEIELNDLDLKTLEGVEELEALCTMYAKAYVIKLRLMK